jgi:hypothetical protein
VDGDAPTRAERVGQGDAGHHGVRRARIAHGQLRAPGSHDPEAFIGVVRIVEGLEVVLCPRLDLRPTAVRAERVEVQVEEHGVERIR